MKIITALALISLGIIFSIFLVQAIDLQARLDSRDSARANVARINR